MIKNIVFDLGGIIVGLNDKLCIAALKDIGAINTASYVETHRTEDLFLDIELGRITTEEFCHRVRMMDHIQADDSTIVNCWNQLLAQFPLWTIDTIDRLRHQYRLFLLSNTNDMHWQYFLQQTKEIHSIDATSLFLHCFLSYEMGMKKPSREIFETVVTQAGINAAETLYIDDNADNCSSAQQVGMQVICDPEGMNWKSEIDKKLAHK